MDTIGLLCDCVELHSIHHLIVMCFVLKEFYSAQSFDLLVGVVLILRGIVICGFYVQNTSHDRHASWIHLNNQNEISRLALEKKKSHRTQVQSQKNHLCMIDA